MEYSPGWVADVGNTRIAMARFENGRLAGAVHRVSTVSGRPTLPETCGLPLHVVSVNPRFSSEILPELSKVGFGPIIVWGDDRAIPVGHPYPLGEHPGGDRLAAIHAAWRRCRMACIVVDAGTALTVDVAAADGRFVGGAIAPGFRALAAGLAQLAPGLPKVGIRETLSDYPGTTTKHCLELGLAAAATGMLEVLLRQARKTAGRDAQVFVTGGDAALVARYVPEVEMNRADDLVLEGIAAFAGLIT